MPQVTIDGESHEVSIDDIQLEEDQLIIDKNSPPSGFFTQKALDAKIQQRLSKERDRVKKSLKDDEEFQQEILNVHGIQLDENGDPKGLDPGFDKQEWIQAKAKEIKKPLEDELETFRSKYERTKSSRIKDSILAAAKGNFEEKYTKKPDDGVDPIVVSQYQSLFTENDEGGIVKVDKDGNVEVDSATGEPITPEKYFSNQDKFGDWMVDKRQRGTGFQNGAGGGKSRFTEDQIKKMSDKEYEENRGEILKAAGDGRVD